MNYIKKKHFVLLNEKVTEVNNYKKSLAGSIYFISLEIIFYWKKDPMRGMVRKNVRLW